MARGAIGVDVGGTNLRAVRMEGGRILDRRAETITKDPEAVMARIVALCHELDGPAVDAVGVGIPGRVDPSRRAVLSGGYVDLAGYDLVRDLEASLGKQVAIDNDCSMALRAEMAIGAAEGCGNVVMFTIGTGIGGAIALGGTPVHGAGTAGQLGHITVEPGGRPCNCGRQGCVETTSSGSALARHMIEVGMPAGTRVEALLRDAARGDPAATEVLRRWVLPLRAAIDSMVAAFAPDLVLLGGGLGHAARAALDHAPALSPWYQCRVEAARLGDDAGVIGAALAAEHHTKSPAAAGRSP